MSRVIRLNTGRLIGDGQPAFLVAEIGQNHQGDVYTALRLAKECHAAGVDAIKLCKRHLPSDMTAAMAASPYTGPQSFGVTYGEHRAALELEPREYAHLKDRLRYNHWPEVLFATVCDVQSANEIEAAIDPPLYKIASRDLDNIPLIAHVAAFGKPMVLSLGMYGIDTAAYAVHAIRQHHDQIIVCACVSSYPTDEDQVRFWWMDEIAHELDVLVGWSDHTAGITIPTAAVAFGACYVEKHVTLARAMRGTDHAASLEPDGIRRWVRNTRTIEAGMRTDQPDLPDRPAHKLCRSLVSCTNIEAGTVIPERAVCLKSPGTGCGWLERDKVIGKVAACNIPADVTIEANMLAVSDQSNARV